MLTVAGDGGAPLATFHHPTLLSVWDEFVARFAFVGGGGGVIVGPGHLCPAEVLHVGAVGARDEVASLIALCVEPLDATEVLDGGRGAGNDLAVPVILGSADAELDLVALSACRGWVAVCFVEEDHAPTYTTEATRRISTNKA